MSYCKLCGKKLSDPHETWCPLYDDAFGRVRTGQ